MNFTSTVNTFDEIPPRSNPGAATAFHMFNVCFLDSSSSCPYFRPHFTILDLLMVKYILFTYMHMYIHVHTCASDLHLTFNMQFVSIFGQTYF